MERRRKAKKAQRASLSTEYANLLLFRLLEILYDSKGQGAKFRTCILGKEDFVHRYGKEGLRFTRRRWEENRDRCRDFLRHLGIIQNVSCAIDKNVAQIQFDSCIHYPAEKMLMKEEVPPYTCICANLLALGIEKATRKQTEIAKIEPGEKACRVKMLLFEESKDEGGE
jgi:hypothetical protein